MNRYRHQPDGTGEWGVWDTKRNMLVTMGLTEAEAEQGAKSRNEEFLKIKLDNTIHSS